MNYLKDYFCPINTTLSGLQPQLWPAAAKPCPPMSVPGGHAGCVPCCVGSGARPLTWASTCRALRPLGKPKAWPPSHAGTSVGTTFCPAVQGPHPHSLRFCPQVLAPARWAQGIAHWITLVAVVSPLIPSGPMAPKHSPGRLAPCISSSAWQPHWPHTLLGFPEHCSLKKPSGRGGLPPPGNSGTLHPDTAQSLPGTHTLLCDPSDQTPSLVGCCGGHFPLPGSAMATTTAKPSG